MTHPTFTRASKSALDQRSRVLALYRESLRSAETMCKSYAINYPPSVIKKTIRHLFDENAHFEGKQLDAALLKGQMELREALMIWKQPTHINRLISKYLNHQQTSNNPKSGFLQDFITGKIQ
eukprot:NODE_56_length_28873_cov_1.243101.p20 type:complete len:122 gc:universal NODE_56_length_28873_cov_1.243101:26454-26819(+)